jgi:hypothetical protein
MYVCVYLSVSCTNLYSTPSLARSLFCMVPLHWSGGRPITDAEILDSVGVLRSSCEQGVMEAAPSAGPAAAAATDGMPCSRLQFSIDGLLSDILTRAVQQHPPACVDAVAAVQFRVCVAFYDAPSGAGTRTGAGACTGAGAGAGGASAVPLAIVVSPVVCAVHPTLPVLLPAAGVRRRARGTGTTSAASEGSTAATGAAAAAAAAGAAGTAAAGAATAAAAAIPHAPVTSALTCSLVTSPLDALASAGGADAPYWALCVDSDSGFKIYSRFTFPSTSPPSQSSESQSPDYCGATTRLVVRRRVASRSVQSCRRGVEAGRPLNYHNLSPSFPSLIAACRPRHT